MADAKNFLDYYEKLHYGIRWAAANVGSRLLGTLALFSNAVAQGTTQVLINRLPGHPDCAPDATDQIGKNRNLFRFSAETQANWTQRVYDAWDQYEQGGTPQAVLKDVEAWGVAAYPIVWDVITPPVATIQEDGWARFTLTLPYGSTPWLPAPEYGSGIVYGDGHLYGVQDATAVEIDHLRRLVRKWKPARSRGTIRAILTSGVAFYGDGHTYGDGTVYAGPSDVLLLTV